MSVDEPFAEPLGPGEKWWVDHGHPFLVDNIRAAPTSALVGMLMSDAAFHNTVRADHVPGDPARWVSNTAIAHREDLLRALVAAELDRRVPVPTEPECSPSGFEPATLENS